MNLVFREATQPDLPAIVRLLADDEIGCRREAYADPLPECYRAAFERIQADANSRLILACMGEEIVGFFQITFHTVFISPGSDARHYGKREGGRRQTEPGDRDPADPACGIPGPEGGSGAPPAHDG